jgi:hypothetical protein
MGLPDIRACDLMSWASSGDSTGSDFERAAWKAALEIVRGKLSIAKPGHDEYDFDGEQP